MTKEAKEGTAGLNAGRIYNTTVEAMACMADLNGGKITSEQLRSLIKPLASPSPIPSEGPVARDDAAKMVDALRLHAWDDSGEQHVPTHIANHAADMIEHLATQPPAIPSPMRDEALEEAAKVADGVASDHKEQAARWRNHERRDELDDKSLERFARNNMLEAEAAERIAAAIRQLKHSPAPPGETP